MFLSLQSTPLSLSPSLFISLSLSYSQFRDIYTLDEVKNSRMVFEPLTKLQCWYGTQSWCLWCIIIVLFGLAVPHLMAVLPPFYVAKNLLEIIVLNQRLLKLLPWRWEPTSLVLLMKRVEWNWYENTKVKGAFKTPKQLPTPQTAPHPPCSFVP